MLPEIPRHMPELEIINADGSSTISHRERALSNFSPHPFTLKGQEFANVEAFVQGIKYPESDEKRQEVFKMRAPRAKRHSPAEVPSFIEWDGLYFKYRSMGHYTLQAAAIFAKFDQNEEALELLLATGNLPITHDLGRPEKSTTCLPGSVFTDILNETRHYYFSNISPCRYIPTKYSKYVTSNTIDYARQ